MRVNAERARGAMFMGNQAQARFSAAEKRALFWNDLGCLGLQRIFAASGVSFENAADLISHIAEDCENFFVRTLCFGGIKEAPMMALKLARENGAGLVGIATDGDYSMDRLVEEFVQVFGPMMGNVDADLGHDFDGERMNIARRF